MTELQTIAATVQGGVEQLERYAQLYAATLSSDRICLGGMMASDIGTLPEQLSPSLAAFFDEQVQWLAKVMNTGKKAGDLNFTGTAKLQATVFLSALQGGLMIANATDDKNVFAQLTQALIGRFK